jgi:tRNA (guanine-N7-)-methyltransferase
LRKDGLIHLKTDEPNLYEFTLETLQEYEGAQVLYHSDDIYSLEELPMPELEIKTYYERMHLAAQKTIKYIRFRLEQ